MTELYEEKAKMNLQNLFRKNSDSAPSGGEHNRHEVRVGLCRERLLSFSGDVRDVEHYAWCQQMRSQKSSASCAVHALGARYVWGA